ncbi:hypothetical protein ACOI1C_18105 [Bacillus sp. DJP31]|uniref:hypothetical protein n=1 Tax=Bacillus sp. DJP31 TaxID=3409789 RepID=UPI003BB4D6A4
MKEQFKKWRVVLPFIVIFLIFTTFQYLHLLDAEKNSNKMPWSRSVDLQMKSDNRSPLIVTDDNQLVLFSGKTGGINQYLVNPDLSVSNLGEIKAPVTSQDSFWTNGVDALYVKEETLYYQNGSGDPKKLLESVNLLKANEGLVVVSQEQGLYIINLSTFDPIKIADQSSPAEDLILTLQQNSFVTATPGDAGLLNFTLYKEGWKSTELFQYDTNYATYAGLDYLEMDGNVHTILTTSSRKGGGKLTLTNQYANLSLANPTGYEAFSELRINDSETANRLGLIKGFNIFHEDGTVKLLFASESTLNDTDAVNIFMASQIDETWKATRISTTDLPSSKPIWVDQSFITWLDFEASTMKYSIMGASTHTEAVEASLQLSKQDYINALSRTLLSSSGALIFLLVSFLVLFPPAIVVIGMNVLNVYNKTRAKWLAIVSYFITQFIFVQRFFEPNVILDGPFFIAFSFSQYILPLLAIAIALFSYKFFRNPNWGEESEVTYIVLLHLFMMVVMVGPYVF